MQKHLQLWSFSGPQLLMIGIMAAAPLEHSMPTRFIQVSFLVAAGINWSPEWHTTNLKVKVVYYMDNGTSAFTWSNEIATWKHISSYKLRRRSVWSRTGQRSLANLNHSNEISINKGLFLIQKNTLQKLIYRCMHLHSVHKHKKNVSLANIIQNYKKYHSHSRIYYQGVHKGPQLSRISNGWISHMCTYMYEQEWGKNHATSDNFSFREEHETTVAKRIRMVQPQNLHTTILPFSKVVVYRKVQKSRAGAKVVGAYIWKKLISVTQREIQT